MIKIQASILDEKQTTTEYSITPKYSQFFRLQLITIVMEFKAQIQPQANPGKISSAVVLPNMEPSFLETAPAHTFMFLQNGLQPL